MGFRRLAEGLDGVAYAINPKAVPRYRDRHRMGGAKSDRGDAEVLADLVRTDRHNHRPVAGDSPEAEEGRDRRCDRVAYGLGTMACESGPVLDSLLSAVAIHPGQVHQHREPGV